MEQNIETFIDNGLERIASQLHFGSIIIGIVFIIVGIILLTNKKRRKINSAIVCIIIGIIAVVSGATQIMY